MTSVVTVTRDAPSRPEAHVGEPMWRRPPIVLAFVAVSYTLIQLLAGRLDSPLSWDETIYVSQFGADAPAAIYSPHRSIGTALLVAPVTVLGGSVAIIRTYLAVLSGLGLFLAFLPWLKIRTGYAVPLAAALFTTPWVALYYGERAMPNLYIAYCVVAAVALFVRAARAPGRLGPAYGPAAWPADVFGLAAVFGALTLLRPMDGALTAAPMLAAAVVTRGWRGLPGIAAIAAGSAAGWGQWLVESYSRFGDPLARLRDTAKLNDAGLHPSMLRQLEALSGNLACYPGHVCGPASLSGAAWWSAGGLLVAVTLLVAVRRRHPLRAVWALTVAVAAVVALPYLVATGYTAPRYLLPAYALLALPAAAGLRTLVTSVRRPRPLAAALSLVVAVHLAVQLDSLRHVSAVADAEYAEDQAIAGRLVAMGVRPPCLIAGERAALIAYRLKCENWDLTGNLYSRAELDRRLGRAAAHQTVATLMEGESAGEGEGGAGGGGGDRKRLWPDRTWYVTVRPSEARSAGSSDGSTAAGLPRGATMAPWWT